MQIEVARRLAERFPEADIRVPVSGPFSIASNLVGFDTLLHGSGHRAGPGGRGDAAPGRRPGAVRPGRSRMRGVDVAFFESAACPPMLSPQLFRQIELPALKQIMDRIGEVVGHPIPCIIGGNTAPIVEAMLETGTGYLVAPFETDQAAFMAGVADRPDVRIRINMDLRIVASGTHAPDRSRGRPRPGPGRRPAERLPGHRRPAVRNRPAKRPLPDGVRGSASKTLPRVWVRALHFLGVKSTSCTTRSISNYVLRRCDGVEIRVPGHSKARHRR